MVREYCKEGLATVTSAGLDFGTWIWMRFVRDMYGERERGTVCAGGDAGHGYGYGVYLG